MPADRSNERRAEGADDQATLGFVTAEEMRTVPQLQPAVERCGQVRAERASREPGR